MHKQIKIRNSFTTSYWQVSSHFQESLHHTDEVNIFMAHSSYLGRQMPQLQTSPLPPSFPQLSLLNMTAHSTGYPFGQLGSAVPPVSPPNFSCNPSLQKRCWDCANTVQ